MLHRFSTHLSIKNLSSLDRVGGAAEHKARGHITLLDPLYLENQASTPEMCGRYMWLADLGLDVLPRGHLSHLNIVRPDLIHFDFRLVKVRVSHKSEERTLWTHPVWHNQELVPRFHRSRLHLKCIAWMYFLICQIPTFPISTVPISLYLSTIGIMNGPSTCLFNVSSASM